MFINYSNKYEFFKLSFKKISIYLLYELFILCNVISYFSDYLLQVLIYIKEKNMKLTW